MNGSNPCNMRMPNLQDIYNHKTSYEHHKRKLTQIYETRKSHLGYNNNRVREFNTLKENKAKSFINKFNQKSSVIAHENLRLLGKLQRVKTSLSQKSVSQEKERLNTSYNPLVKKRIFETQKQNMRISNRMKNMSSSLNQKLFLKDHAKSQKIKSRLMKYANGGQKVHLKSQRYFQLNDSKSENHKILKIKKNQRNSMFTHYKRDEILKNKVDTSTSSLAKIRMKNQRPNTSFQSGTNPEKVNSFFATEPRKNFIHIKKKIGIKKL